MKKIHVIGIGFRPLDRIAANALLRSDVVLVNNRLLDVFKDYKEYEHVSDRIIVHPGVHETMDYIRDNHQIKSISLLAAGDPMFFGIGRLVVEKFGKEPVEVHPDLSSVQVAFSRIKETSNNALFISLHGGPDPEKRRELEYEIDEVPALLERHNKIAILTDKINNPAIIAKALISHISNFNSQFKIFVCEKLGYAEEKITADMPDEISEKSFEHPNVVVIVRKEKQ